MSEIEREAFEHIRQLAWAGVGARDHATADRMLVKIHEYAKEQAARAQTAQPASGVPEGWQQRLIEDYRREYIGQGVESWLAALPDRLLITQNGGPSDE